MIQKFFCLTVFSCSLFVGSCLFAQPEPTLILHNGKIATVDRDFAIFPAMAVAGDRISAVGDNAKILALAGPKTVKLDLQGKMVLPGLIDSHVHASSASTYEYDHTVPDVETIADVLKYIRSRVEALPQGAWIKVEQMFITRLVEQRFPTRAELDEVAPFNPVVFRTGPDMAVNSLALRLSGIDEDFQLPTTSTGRIERDDNGRISGIIRGASGVVKFAEKSRKPSMDEQLTSLERLIHDYNSVGITSISDRNATNSAIELFEYLQENGRLNARTYLYYSIDADEDPATIESQIKFAANHKLHQKNEMLWLRGVKVFLDGGMLTGSAYMRQPWGKSEIYSIIDPEYRGTLKIAPERLYQISKMALQNKLQMTAHAVGDGAVHNLIDAYEAVDQDFSVAPERPCITHCNFMSADAIVRMKRLGIVADLQPAWLLLDGATLKKQFGDERLSFFQPYRALFDAGVNVGGGSDHMQKVGSLRSVNPYNPFLGIWITIVRQPRRDNSPLHAEQSITREEAIRLYTINNAYLTFEENEKGSIEVGKLADFVIIDRDILSCATEDIKETKVVSTYLGGRKVYAQDDSKK